MRIHVDVTAEDIAAAGGPFTAAGTHADPIERALARVFGRHASVDGDASDPAHDIATIGDGQTVLVLDLPPATYDWSERYYGEQRVEPFGFDLEIEDWLVDLVRSSAPEAG